MLQCVIHIGKFHRGTHVSCLSACACILELKFSTLVVIASTLHLINGLTFVAIYTL